MHTFNNIIFFDGICNLCNNTVVFILKRDPKHVFKFAALQSPIAKKILGNDSSEVINLQSIVLFQNNNTYTQSTAALLIAKQLSGYWPLFYYFFIWWPKFIRDGLYNFIAHNRYRWFGKKKSCLFTLPEHNNRFLEEA